MSTNRPLLLLGVILIASNGGMLGRGEGVLPTSQKWYPPFQYCYSYRMIQYAKARKKKLNKKYIYVNLFLLLVFIIV